MQTFVEPDPAGPVSDLITLQRRMSLSNKDGAVAEPQATPIPATTSRPSSGDGADSGGDGNGDGVGVGSPIWWSLPGLLSWLLAPVANVSPAAIVACQGSANGSLWDGAAAPGIGSAALFA